MPYSAEAKRLLKLRPHNPVTFEFDHTTHKIPETPEQIEASDRVTQKMLGLFGDNVLWFYGAHFVDLASHMLYSGIITEEQHKKIFKAWRSIPKVDQGRVA